MPQPPLADRRSSAGHASQSSHLFFRPGPGWLDIEGRVIGRERAALDPAHRSLAAESRSDARRPHRADADVMTTSTERVATAAGAAMAHVSPPAEAPIASGRRLFFRQTSWLDREGRPHGRFRAALSPLEQLLATTATADATPVATVETATPDTKTTAIGSTKAAAGSAGAPADARSPAIAKSTEPSATAPAAETKPERAPMRAGTSAGGASAQAKTQEPEVPAPAQATAKADARQGSRTASSPPSADIPAAGALAAGSSGTQPSARAAGAAQTTWSSDGGSASMPVGEKSAPKSPDAQPLASSRGPIAIPSGPASGSDAFPPAEPPAPTTTTTSSAAATPAAGAAKRHDESTSPSPASRPTLSKSVGDKPIAAPIATAPASPVPSSSASGTPPASTSAPIASVAIPSPASSSAAAPSVATSGAPTPTASEAGRPPSLAAPREGRADDLKLIKGIGPKNESACHALGVHHFDQIAAWSPQNAVWVGHHIAFPGRIEREHWIDQAKLLSIGVDTPHAAGVRSGAIVVDAAADAPLTDADVSALRQTMPALSPEVENQHLHPGLRPVGLAAARGTPDDLQRIRGIGKQNEARLHALGIWHFTQIAAWTPDQVQWVGSYLAFPGRITREAWLSQAAGLAAGEPALAPKPRRGQRG